MKRFVVDVQGGSDGCQERPSTELNKINFTKIAANMKAPRP